MVAWRDAGIGCLLAVLGFVGCRRRRRSHFSVVRGFVSRIVGWITVCRGRDATIIFVSGDLDSCAMKDSGVVGGVRVRRWRVRAGMVDDVE
jgi:hypothetical protein